MLNRHLGLGRARALVARCRADLARHDREAAAAATPRARYAALSMGAFSRAYLAKIETYLASVGHPTGSDRRLAFEEWAAAALAAQRARSAVEAGKGSLPIEEIEAAVIARRLDVVGELLEGCSEPEAPRGIQPYPFFWRALVQGDAERARRAAELVRAERRPPGRFEAEREHGFPPATLGRALLALLDRDEAELAAALEEILARHDALAWPPIEGGRGCGFLLSTTATALLVEAGARALEVPVASGYAPVAAILGGPADLVAVKVSRSRGAASRGKKRAPERPPGRRLPVAESLRVIEFCARRLHDIEDPGRRRPVGAAAEQERLGDLETSFTVSQRLVWQLAYLASLDDPPDPEPQGLALGLELAEEPLRAAGAAFAAGIPGAPLRIRVDLPASPPTVAPGEPRTRAWAERARAALVRHVDNAFALARETADACGLDAFDWCGVAEASVLGDHPAALAELPPSDPRWEPLTAAYADWWRGWGNSDEVGRRAAREAVARATATDLVPWHLRVPPSVLARLLAALDASDAAAFEAALAELLAWHARAATPRPWPERKTARTPEALLVSMTATALVRLARRRGMPVPASPPFVVAALL